MLMVSGMVSVSGMPRAAATKASAMPVLPLVGSTISLPGQASRFGGIVDHGHTDAILYRVRRIAAFDLGQKVAFAPSTMRFNLTSGVLPTDNELSANWFDMILYLK